MQSVMMKNVNESDRRDILRILTAAFGGDSEARLVENLWANKAIELERLAAIDGETVGYCAFSRVVVTPPIEGVALGLAPVAVAPAFQNRGVGSTLIRECLAQAREIAAAVILLGHKHYYPRFGFAPASKKNVTWDVRDAGDSFQLLDFVGAFDGAARQVSYHPAFGAV